MKRELDEKLCKIAPTLFGDRFADKRSTALCWGFECGDGWFDLLKEAAEKLEPLCRVEYNKAAAKEKAWYKYVRAAIAPTYRISFIYHLLMKIVNIIQPNMYNNALYWYGGAPCRASQIKEKYGTLRFYMTASTPEMDKIIDEADAKSAVTCENCGKKGKLRGNGWLRDNGWFVTRCLPCFKKRDNS